MFPIYNKIKEHLSVFFYFGGGPGILRFACGQLAFHAALPLGGAARGGQTVHRTLCFSALRIPLSTAKRKKHPLVLFLFGGGPGILRFACDQLAFHAALPLGGAARGGQTVHRTLCFSALRIPLSTAKRKKHPLVLFLFGGGPGIRTQGPARDTAFRVPHDRPL